jgi:hypothetical protein
MTTVTARALEMRLLISRLMREHRVQPTPVTVPLTEPTPCAMVLEGLAATSDLDLDRVKLRAYAFGFPLLFRRGFPPLLFKHDPAHPAGRIESLSYDEGGCLLIRATVTHELARRCGAFSIGARVIEYEMRDVDGPNFYAVINCAELTEVSLTSTPANPKAVVRHRYRATLFFDQMRERVRLLVSLTELIKQEVRAC